MKAAIGIFIVLSANLFAESSPYQNFPTTADQYRQRQIRQQQVERQLAGYKREVERLKRKADEREKALSNFLQTKVPQAISEDQNQWGLFEAQNPGNRSFSDALPPPQARNAPARFTQFQKLEGDTTTVLQQISVGAEESKASTVYAKLQGKPSQIVPRYLPVEDSTQSGSPVTDAPAEGHGKP